MAELTDEQKTEAVRDLNQKVFEYAMEKHGCTHEQAEAFAATQVGKFSWTGVRLIWNDTKTPAVDEPAAKAYYGQDKFKFLLPQKAPAADQQDGPQVPPNILELALMGNVTAFGKISRALGDADRATTERFIAAEREKRTNNKNDGDRNRDEGGRFTEKPKASNPWSAEGWNLTKQMQTHRADPALAERLAKAANSRVGAARPTKVA